MSGCPERHKAANQEIWKAESRTVVDGICERIELYLSSEGAESLYPALYEWSAGERRRVANIIAKNDWRTNLMGWLRDKDFAVSEYVSLEEKSPWRGLASVLVGRVESLLLPQGEECAGYRLEFDVLRANKPSLIVFLQGSSSDVQARFTSIQTEYDKDENLTGFKLSYASREHATLWNSLAQEYLQACLVASSQSSLLRSLARLMHLICNTLAVSAGNAAIAQWIGTAILKHHGYHIEHFITHGFPQSSDGLPFDWVAIVSPDVNAYADEFEHLFNEAIEKNNLKGACTLEMNAHEDPITFDVVKRKAPGLVDDIPDYILKRPGFIVSQDYQSLPSGRSYMLYKPAFITKEAFVSLSVDLRILLCGGYDDRGVPLKWLIDNKKVDIDTLKWLEALLTGVSDLDKKALMSCLYEILSRVKDAGETVQSYLEGLTDEQRELLFHNAANILSIVRLIEGEMISLSLISQELLDMFRKSKEFDEIDRLSHLVNEEKIPLKLLLTLPVEWQIYLLRDDRFIGRDVMGVAGGYLCGIWEFSESSDWHLLEATKGAPSDFGRRIEKLFDVGLSIKDMLKFEKQHFTALMKLSRSDIDDVYHMLKGFSLKSLSSSEKEPLVQLQLQKLSIHKQVMGSPLIFIPAARDTSPSCGVSAGSGL